MKLSIFALFATISTSAAFTPSTNGPASTTNLFSTVEATPTSTKTKAPVFDEVCETTGVTLTRFMSEVAMLNPEISELTTLFGAIDTSCKAITNLVKRSQLPSSETLGLEGEVNIQGEDQKKLDVITNDLLKRALRFTGKLGVLASEEEDDPVDLIGNEEGASKEVIFEETSKYVVVFDPLDGSSNVDAGIPTGTIIGVYEHDENCIVDDKLADDQCLANTLQPGTNLVAAAYCLYSSSTFLVLTLGNGVYMFTLDEEIGEFILAKPNVKIPESSSIISFNEANIEKWDEPMKNTVKAWREGTGASGSRYSSRYIGSMVGDVHRTLLYGGVFGYPADTKNTSGKLRLLYEGAPMSFIMEQAGGLSTTGTERVMEITPDFVHQRVPIVMGSKNCVQEVIDAYEAAATN
jgi:fructose-1,6-bisphosphatase I